MNKAHLEAHFEAHYTVSARSEHGPSSGPTEFYVTLRYKLRPIKFSYEVRQKTSIIVDKDIFYGVN